MNNSEWATPQGMFDRLNKEFRFTLDVCATPENAKCKRYFTREQNGLEQKWDGRVWMNPPYGKEIAAWMRKAHESHLAGAVVVSLVPSRTNAPWWHDYVMKADEIRFIRKKVSFGGRCKGVPFTGSVIAIFNTKRQKPKVTSYDQ